MLILKIEALENGAHQNQDTLGLVMHNIPDGWIAVPNDLYDKAKSFLPFIDLIIKDDILIDVKQGEEIVIESDIEDETSNDNISQQEALSMLLGAM